MLITEVFLFLILWQLPKGDAESEIHLPVPSGLSAALADDSIKRHYVLTDRINPFYLWGYIDDDRIPDYAVLLRRRSDSAEVALVFLSSQKDPVMIYDSSKINHSQLQGWEICHDRDCGVPPLGRERSKREPSARSRSDFITLHFGGAGYMWFWDGKKLQSKPWGE